MAYTTKSWLFLASFFLCLFECANGKHVVLMLTDDLGYGAPGYQNDHIISPTLDSLAASGVVLTRHYTYRYCECYCE